MKPNSTSASQGMGLYGRLGGQDHNKDTEACTISSVLGKLAQLDTEERELDATIHRIAKDLEKSKERAKQLKCKRTKLEDQLNILESHKRLFDNIRITFGEGTAGLAKFKELLHAMDPKKPDFVNFLKTICSIHNVNYADAVQEIRMAYPDAVAQNRLDANAVASNSQIPVVTSTVATLETPVVPYIKSEPDVPLLDNANKTRKRKITKSPVEINIKEERDRGIGKSINSKVVKASASNVPLTKSDNTKKVNIDPQNTKPETIKVKLEKVDQPKSGSK